MKKISLLCLALTSISFADPRPANPTEGQQNTLSSGKPEIFTSGFWRTDWASVGLVTPEKLTMALENATAEERNYISLLLGVTDDITLLPESFAYWTQDDVSGTGIIDQIFGRTLTSTATITPVEGFLAGGSDADERSFLDILPNWLPASAKWEVLIKFKLVPGENTLQMLRSPAFNQWRLLVTAPTTVSVRAMIGGSQVTQNVTVPAFDTTGATEHSIRLEGTSSEIKTTVDGTLYDTWSASFDPASWAQLGRHSAYLDQWQLTGLTLEEDDIVIAHWDSSEFTADGVNPFSSAQGNHELRITNAGSGSPIILGDTQNIFSLASLLAPTADADWISNDSGNLFYDGASAPINFNASIVGPDGPQVFVSSNASSSNFKIYMTDAPVTPARASQIQGLLDGTTPSNPFDPSKVFLGLDFGQSNSGGGGVSRATYPALTGLQAFLGVEQGSGGTPGPFYFGTYGNLEGNGYPRDSTAADDWYAEAMQRGGYNGGQFGIADYSRGGTPINAFEPGGSVGPIVDAVLTQTQAALEAEFPLKTVELKFAYFDQVEFDGGNGSNQSLSQAQYEANRDARAVRASRLYDALNGQAAVNYAVTGTNVQLFIRDIGDGQTNIGGGGPAAPGTWNGWQAIRDAHQLLITPGNPYYRPGIHLVNSDGLVCADGVHFNALQQRDIADRFLQIFNSVFNTSLTIAAQ